MAKMARELHDEMKWSRSIHIKGKEISYIKINCLVKQILLQFALSSQIALELAPTS